MHIAECLLVMASLRCLAALAFGSKQRSPSSVYPDRSLPMRMATYGCGGLTTPVATRWQPTRQELMKRGKHCTLGRALRQPNSG